MSQQNASALSLEQYNELKKWYAANKDSWPPHIAVALGILLSVYHQLADAKAKVKDLLVTMRLAMGVTPKSESGRTLTKQRWGAG